MGLYRSDIGLHGFMWETELNRVVWGLRRRYSEEVEAFRV